MLHEYYQHRYSTVKTTQSRTASTGQKGSESTYDCSVLLRQLRSIRHSVPATTIRLLSSRWYCRGWTTEMPSWPVFLPTWSGVFSRLTVRRRKHGRKVGVDLRWMGWIASLSSSVRSPSAVIAPPMLHPFPSLRSSLLPLSIQLRNLRKRCKLPAVHGVTAMAEVGGTKYTRQ